MENQTLFLIKIIRTTLLTLLVITFISCNTTEAELPSKSDFNNFSEEPYIIDKITNIGTKNIGEESYLTVLVEENPKVHEGGKISFFVSDSTEILMQKKNGDIENFSKNKLKKNQIVGGWTTGVIFQSYPTQGGATRIVVVE